MTRLRLLAGLVAVPPALGCSDGAESAAPVATAPRTVEDRADDGIERVPVFEVVCEIPAGTPGADAISLGYVEEAVTPAEYSPPNAVVALDEIDDRRAVSDLFLNQVPVVDMFVEPTPDLPPPIALAGCR